MGINDSAWIHGGCYSDDAYFACIGIYLHLGHLNLMDTRFKGRSLTGFGIQNRFLALRNLGAHIACRFASLHKGFVSIGANLLHGFFQLLNSKNKGTARHISHSAGRCGSHSRCMVGVSSNQTDFVHRYAGEM